VPSLESRIRDLADHAGPSPPTHPLSLPGSLRPENSYLSLSSSLLIALLHMETTDAEVELSEVDTLTLLMDITSRLRMSIHILELTTPVLTKASERLLAPAKPVSQETQTLSELQLPNSQSQLLLPLVTTPSSPTKEESSELTLDAQPELITVSPLLVMDPRTELITSSSRTPGEQAGERMDTSDWKPPLDAELAV